MTLHTYKIHEGDSESRQFVWDCRWLAGVLGSLKKKYVISSSVTGEYLHYEDQVLVVESSLSNLSMTITGKSEEDGGILKVTNPVVYIDEEGLMYRWHGESHLLFNHAREEVAKKR